MQMPDQDLTITYFIPVSSFQVILSQVDMFLEFRANPDSSTDFSKDMFERKFEANLNTFNNVIKDEIEMYTI